jgi:4-hydroxybenzoate polyprenyltransferase
MIGIHAFSTVMDYTADLQAGSTTFAVVFGKRLAASFPFIVFSITLQTPEFQRFPIGPCLLVGAVFSFVVVVYPSEKLAHVFLKLMALTFTLLAIFVLIYNAMVLNMI